MAVPRVLTIDVDLPLGETLLISPITDIHIEGSRCSFDGMKKEMAQRAGPFHRALLFGDVFDMVVPPDLARFQPSCQSGGLHGRDDWANAAVEIAEERLRSIDGMKIDGIGVGNHEFQYMKRHGFDVTSALCSRLKANRVGYSGIVRYRIKRPGKSVKAEVLTIAFHHGAWGGKVAKGYSGARDFFSTFQGWHFACFGHNHWTKIEPERRMRVTPKGKLKSYPVYYVLCGSQTDAYDERDASNVDYSELKGYAPQLRMTPWMKVKIGPSNDLVYWPGVGEP